MGTIRTTGKAYREIEYDKMKISVTFNSRERRSKDAIKKVVDQCEQFLAELKKLGVDTSLIRADKNKVEKNNYSSEKDSEAYRAIKWNMNYDPLMVEAVMKLSENGSYNVDIDIDPIYSRKHEVYKELMNEATLDAKATADILAKSLGKKVKGPSKINASGDYDYYNDDKYMDDSRDGAVYGIRLGGNGSSRGLYTDLNNPSEMISRDITIEWELED